MNSYSTKRKCISHWLVSSTGWAVVVGWRVVINNTRANISCSWPINRAVGTTRCSSVISWPYQRVALSLHPQRYRSANTKPPRHQYKQHNTNNLQSTDKVEVVVQVAVPLGLFIRTTVDVPIIVCYKPDIFKPPDGRRTEQRTNSLWEPIESHDDSLHWPWSIDVCQLKSYHKSKPCINKRLKQITFSLICL